MSFTDNKSTDRKLRIERVSEDHITQIAEIEKECFSEPWSESSLALLCTDAYPSFALCRENGEVLGYIGTTRALDELQIINVAIKKEYRRQGLGRALLRALDEYCFENGISSVSLEVRCSNTAAISLYESLGYLAVGTRKGFYRFPTEDAKIMVKSFADK